MSENLRAVQDSLEQEEPADPSQERRIRAWEFIFECYEQNQRARREARAEEDARSEVST